MAPETSSNSEVDITELGGRPNMSSRKRSTRACDQCRKSKSKCTASTSNPDRCMGCVEAGTHCTHNAPVYKRGPPRGYISAIEQRWQQVESILGAILASTDSRAQGIVADLKKDSLASEILDRVCEGPYGPLDKLLRPATATREDFFQSILMSSGPGQHRPAVDNSQPRRESRVSREYVSSCHDLNQFTLAAPTTEWQDSLVDLLTPTDARKDGVAQATDRASSIPAWTAFEYNAMPVAKKRRFEDFTGEMGTPKNYDESSPLNEYSSVRMDEAPGKFVEHPESTNLYGHPTWDSWAQFPTHVDQEVVLFDGIPTAPNGHDHYQATNSGLSIYRC